LLGAGKIGAAIAKFLTASGEYDVLVADVDEASLLRLEKAPDVGTVSLTASDPTALRQAMGGRQAVVSALSFALNPLVAQVALEAGLSYFDLTEDRETTT